MNAELSEIKYIDEKNNEYIIGALSDYNNERYGLMINIHNPIDFFIAKIINNQDNIELEKDITNNNIRFEKMIYNEDN